MPVGSRVRGNNAYGITTDNPLGAGAPTFNSTQLQLLPAVSSPSQHALIVLDPKRVFGEPEIVTVTAHTGLSTSATITRAQYSTTARSHPVGTAWAHVAINEDYTAIVTSITRPANPYSGQFIYETDTSSHRFYDGSVWNSAPPIGSIFAFGGVSAPSGYLLANGAAVSRTGATADLFAVFGTTYGSGDGVTTFNLPNLSGRVPVGRNVSEAEFDLLGETGGVKTVTLTTSQIPIHAHGITDVQHSHSQSGGTHAHPIDNSIQHAHGTSGGYHEHSIDGDYGLRVIVTGGANDFLVNVAEPNRTQVVTISDIEGENVTSVGGASSGVNLTINNNPTNISSTQNGNANAGISSAFSNLSGTNNTGSGGSHDNLQPYITVNYIVKY